MRYFVFALLFIFGMLTRITSSEFWPVTISKTWLTPSHFEISMLQKPLLTLALSTLHIFGFSDVVHLIVAKLIFSLLGVLGFYIFIKYVFKVSKQSLDKTLLVIATSGLFVLISPTYLGYFSSIRSDQAACFLFCLFLFCCETKKSKAALSCLFLIPLTGIKEILFLVPGIIYFFWSFPIKSLNKNHYFIAGLGLCLLIWAVNFNIQFAHYLFDSYAETNYLHRFHTVFYKDEFLPLFLAILSCFYIFLKRHRQYYKLTMLSLFFTAAMLGFPQSYYFFMASLIPFIYLPFVVLFLSSQWKRPLAIILTLTQLFLIYPTFVSFYQNTVLTQYNYISTAASIVEKNNFTYLDGMGILPAQKFYPCFASPYDIEAKNGCLNPSNKPDVIIITGRLSELGAEVYAMAQKEYVQIRPNFWVLKTSMNKDIELQIDLDGSDLQIPILIF